MTKLRDLRSLIDGRACHMGPGVFDGLSARIAEAAGFPFVHASGGAIARGIGFPDLGLVTMTEMLGRIAEMVDAVSIPVVADADTGYGNAHNAARCARAYRAAGVAALHVEDQTFPKKCGLYDDLALVPAGEMADKIAAMKDAVAEELLIVARTDAVKPEGLGSALDRMRHYLDAGADIAFIEGLDTADAIRQAGAIDAPKLINHATASAGLAVSLPELGVLGFRLAIYPGDLQRAAIFAMEEAARSVMATGDSRAVAARLATPARRDALVGTERYR